jgi:glyoxalase family protein
VRAGFLSTEPVKGIHHITAIAADPQHNLDFYTEVMGMRLVKLTVNFDDPGTYHFYFGNETGTPGSILTFFPWPGAENGRIGAGQVVAIAFAVPIGSLAFWSARLRAHGVDLSPDVQRFGEQVLRFHDPDGLWLELVESEQRDPGMARQRGPVPAPYALSGFHSATLSELNHDHTARLVSHMGFAEAGREGDRFRYRVSGPVAATLDVLEEPKARLGRLGAGTVHHIAFRAATDEQQVVWRSDLLGLGYHVTPVIDRMYFHSIYFREPGGVLFEIATDPPGFAIDESPERLGERLMLPGWLESERRDVERRLPVLTRQPSISRVAQRVKSAAE